MAAGWFQGGEEAGGGGAREAGAGLVGARGVWPRAVGGPGRLAPLHRHTPLSGRRQRVADGGARDDELGGGNQRLLPPTARGGGGPGRGGGGAGPLGASGLWREGVAEARASRQQPEAGATASPTQIPNRSAGAHARKGHSSRACARARACARRGGVGWGA
ncbi:MAG: hypothetical protein J3K34DRAFT_67501 [Monoraphidium minutum]|nr:MAG: hypothetical protein J3K34DRAFT_67501 [Monoraphidium minutum]